MRKADHTIVFGSQNAPESRAPTPAFPEPVTRSAHPTPAFFEPSTTASTLRVRPLAEDLVDERAYMARPERSLAFVAVSLALVGVAAAGTYFFLGSRTPIVSTTSTTSAEIAPATPTPAPAASEATAPPPPAPATSQAEQPWDPPQVDAVRAPGVTPPRELPGTQLPPVPRPQASNQAPAKATSAPADYAAKIRGAQFPGAPATAKEVPSKPPPAGMSDEALERAGYYGHITPIVPTAPSTTPNAGEPNAPSAASTEEPSQFTPQPAPSEVMPDVKIKD